MATVQPHPALAPFVAAIWADDSGPPPTARERSMPTGCMHLAFRLSGPAIRLYEGDDDGDGRTYGHAVLGGARASAYVRDTPGPVRSVGVQFRAGGAAALLGIPAHELAGRHTPLFELWGRAADEALERLHEAATPSAQAAVVQSLLLRRVADARATHDAVTLALRRFDAAPGLAVDAVRVETGYSHRRFLQLFERHVGLGPKVYCRVRRLQLALELAEESAGRIDWAGLAVSAGYSDQSHLIREFQAIAGIAPSQYRPRAGQRNHVPLGGRSDSSNRRRRARPIVAVT